MKITSHDLTLLYEYNRFLLKHEFVDCDIDGEGVDSQSAINLFIEEQKEKARNDLHKMLK